MKLPMSHTPAPAHNELEMRAAILLAAQEYFYRNPESKLSDEAWSLAMREFVDAETAYLGDRSSYLGAHKRAKELC